MRFPTRQTSIEIPEPGAPAVLRATDRPVPPPAEQQVTIQVAAARIHRPELCLPM